MARLRKELSLNNKIKLMRAIIGTRKKENIRVYTEEQNTIIRDCVANQIKYLVRVRLKERFKYLATRYRDEMEMMVKIRKTKIKFMFIATIYTGDDSSNNCEPDNIHLAVELSDWKL